MSESDSTKDSEPPEDNQLQGKTILIINSGSLGKRFILEKIKQLGVTMVMLHREKNWAEPFVDHWILADTYNHQACIENIKKFIKKNPHVKICGAITFWEDDIPLLARICETFRFPGNSVETALYTRSKFEMHETLRLHGRPFIPQCLLKHEEDLEKAMQLIGFPAVIKPHYGADSQYVIYVTNAKEATSAYHYVREHCTPSFDPIYFYNHSEFVYQKFIHGKEFSMECYVQNGIPHVIGINEKTGMHLPFFIETGDHCPSRINLEQEYILIQETKATLQALGVKNSLAHVEIKLTKQGPQIIEVGSRMGGVYIYQNVKQVYGFDLIRTACEIALGMMVIEKPQPPQRHVFAKFFLSNSSGIITQMEGFEDLKNHEYVIDHFVSKKRYDHVSVPPEGYDTLGWVVTGGNSAKEAEQRMEKVMRSVRCEVSPQTIFIPHRRPILQEHPAPIF